MGMGVVPDLLFADYCHAHYHLTRVQNPLCLQARAATTIQLLSLAFSVSGSHLVCLVGWEGMGEAGRDGAKRWKILVEHPGPQSFTSNETQFREERRRRA